ncbi:MULTISPECIES: acetyl xylan esterase [Streptomyces]|jgi:acyl carrier protein|uniref:Acyl carrier protein n=1 Tax=Streptomyces sp. 900129855 TaxID=3155129 RepID=A0ABV2ZSZ8_9ACTN|nr:MULTISPECIES: acetyl xylan esterase [unclassified Streptomyces]MDX3240516.1 acyl carrier protein [Streptomyces sp. ME18-1-4]SHH79403.1 acyl carrier protein [Streptomyces sp. 3214.6]
MTEPMQAVREFILGRNPKIDRLDGDLDLIDSRAINSLAFVEFIFLLEELTGEPIDPEDLDLDDFRTLHAIEARFFKQKAA